MLAPRPSCARRPARGLRCVLLAALPLAVALPAAAQDGAAGTETANGAPDSADASYVIEEMRTVYRFERDGTGTKRFGFRVRLRDEAGVATFGRLTVPYVDAFQRVEVERVRVHKPDGRAIDADPDQFQDRSQAGPVYATVYTDARNLHVPVPSIRPGDVLEFEAVVETHTPVAPGRFWIEDVFWDDGVVLGEVIRVDVPAGAGVRAWGTPEADHESRREGDRRVHVWRSSRLRDADDDPASAGRRLLEALEGKPDVLVSSFRGWAGVGEWIGGGVEEAAVPTGELRRRVERLTAGLTSTREKVEALYRHVSEEVRYVALLLGQGRFLPHPAADVLRNGYGDCKDKHTLLAAMLRIAGVESEPVLVHSQRRELVDIPSPSQFDHLITMVPLAGDTLWFDATSGVAPFDFLPWALRGKRVLVASAGGGRIVTTPTEARIADSETVSLRGRLSGTGRLAGRVEIQQSGTPAMGMRGAFRQVPASARQRTVERIVSSLGFPGSVEDGEVEDDSAPEGAFTAAARLSDPDFVEADGGAAAFEAPLPGHELESLPDDGAADSVFFGVPMRNERVMALRVPEGAGVELPVGVELERPYAAYASSYARDGDTVRVRRVFEVRVSRLAMDLRDDYAAFRTAVEADVAQEIRVEIPPDVAERALEEAGVEDVERLHDRAFELVNAGEVDRAEPKLERVVELAPDHEEGWNNLGRVYLEQERLELAEEAFRRQIEIVPFHDHAHNNLGLALRGQDRLDEAEAAFRRQIEIVPLHEYAHGNLGFLLASRDRYEEALPHLERAAKLQPSNEGVLRTYGAALARLGRPEEAAEVLRDVDPELAESLAGAGQGRVAATITRAGSVDELVEAALPTLRRQEDVPTSPETLADFLRMATGEGDAHSRVDSLVAEEPDNAAYRNALACLLLYRGRLEEGLEHALEAARLEPDVPFHWVTVGRLQYLNGSRTFALSAYRRARELDEGALEASPEDLEIYRELEGS